MPLHFMQLPSKNKSTVRTHKVRKKKIDPANEIETETIKNNKQKQKYRFGQQQNRQMHCCCGCVRVFFLCQCDRVESAKPRASQQNRKLVGVRGAL